MAKRKTAEIKTDEDVLATPGEQYRLITGIEDDKLGQRFEAGTVLTLDDLREWPDDVIANWIEIGVLKPVEPGGKDNNA